LTDTIAAIATGATVSAIGIIRISGSNAISVASSIFRATNGICLTNADDRRMYYGEIIDNTSIDELSSPPQHNTIDFCLCMVSRAPSSYTGEDTVEFHCHGSPIVLSEVMRILFSHGVRQALPGEFTKRAFLNGRMDLVQAEAVIDIIESETVAAAQNAAGQLHGVISLKMDSVYNKLTDILAHFHAVIDYPDEDIDEFNIQNYLSSLYSITNELQEMLETHQRSKVLRDGVPTAIVGRPNTGKSSLLNALLGYDRAIVTEIAGTTRDTIEEKVLIGNVLLRLIDTAGLRKTNDKVENLGITRSLEAINTAGLVLLVLDGSEPLHKEDIDALHSIPSEIPKIAIINKSDLPSTLDINKIAELNVEFCTVSALLGEGIHSLSEKIKEIFPEFNSSPSGELITNARQAEAISKALSSIRSASSALADTVTPDAVLADIEVALNAIGEVTGKTMREDIIFRIFERFCVGK